MTIQELRKIGREELKKNNIGEIDAKVDMLLQYILKINKIDLLINCEKNVDKDSENKFVQHINEIIKGEPIQYITNEQEFMQLKFYVDENVLIPQQDTEILVEEAIKKIYEIYEKSKKKIKILDLCTGSGAIAIALEHHIKNTSTFGKTDLEIWGSDISKEALAIAKKNTIINKAKINYILSDMFKNIKENDFDIIVSNPPYIETDTILTLSKEVQSEPHLALDGGKDGLDFYKIIANEAYKYINDNGYVLVEIGYNQKKDVIQLFEQYNKYADIECVKDLSMNDRVVEAIIKK